jgi:hypothetical protein
MPTPACLFEQKGKGKKLKQREQGIEGWVLVKQGKERKIEDSDSWNQKWEKGGLQLGAKGFKERY